jgi:hypothetical protein
MEKVVSYVQESEGNYTYKREPPPLGQKDQGLLSLDLAVRVKKNQKPSYKQVPKTYHSLGSHLQRKKFIHNESKEEESKDPQGVKGGPFTWTQCDPLDKAQ